jgi:hypothetical protein
VIDITLRKKTATNAVNDLFAALPITRIRDITKEEHIRFWFKPSVVKSNQTRTSSNAQRLSTDSVAEILNTENVHATFSAPYSTENTTLAFNPQSTSTILTDLERGRFENGSKKFKNLKALF